VHVPLLAIENYADQPEILNDVVSQTVDWLRRNELTT
jgi:hypothetical protein